MTISAASFVAMIVVLHAYVDQPMSHCNFAIPLNSIIAILAAVFKVSLVVPLNGGLESSQMGLACYQHEASLVRY